MIFLRQRSILLLARLNQYAPSYGWLSCCISLSPEARQLIDEVPKRVCFGKNRLLTFMPGIDNSEEDNQKFLTNI